MLTEILGTLIKSEVAKVYEETVDVTVSGSILCFRCVDMCLYEDCQKIKMADKKVLKSRNYLEPSESE